MTLIHPTAIVHPRAQLASDVTVGPYSIIDEHVSIGEGTWIGSHVVVKGHTTIGRRNRFFQFCSVGEIPQDRKYAGEPTRLEIGDDNTIRESCTLNVGTSQDVGVTRLGDQNWIMAYVHIAHDCQIGNHTIFANCTQLAGHVVVGDWVILGGNTLAHQFVRIGEHSMTSMGSALYQDLPPYVMASGHPAVPRGINSEGLKRRNFSAESITEIKRAYKAIYREGLSLQAARDGLAEKMKQVIELEPLVKFIEIQGRGIIR
jgi:UDP-N-acetylglucosamine acyltransferase